MAILPIVTHPHAVLRQRAYPVRQVTASIRRLLDDMIETMYHARGVGLAAPQIGVSKRVIVVDVGDEQGLITLINPQIIQARGAHQEWEGCLSIPKQFGLMQRATFVRVRGLNQKGYVTEVKAQGYLARALLHEIDHLDGILLFDHALEWDDLTSQPEETS